MSDTQTRTETETVADLVRSAAAWWRLAADALDAGRLEDAERFAYLGHLGTSDMRERISALVNGWQTQAHRPSVAHYERSNR